MATKKTQPADAAGVPMTEPAPKAKRAPKKEKAVATAAVPVATTVVAVATVDPTPAEAAPPAAPAAPTREDVTRLAHELWLARGGSAFANWIEAEQQLAAGR